jgi:excinuclease UvrABC nuclease subunit
MRQAAEALDFERAALLRDQLFELKAEEDARTGKASRTRRSLAQELREAAES